MADTFETYPPLPPSPPPSPPVTSPPVTFPKQADRAPPYIRTSFSPRYIRSNSMHTLPDLSPIAPSPSAPSLRSHSQSRGHRHTQSLNAQAAPPPLPLPVEHTDTGYTSNNENSDVRADTVIRQWRMKRSETDPGLARKAHEPTSLPSLPENPKQWRPSQLAQYLLKALRFKGNKSSQEIPVPKPVAQDIANFVVKYKLSGRAFLRLEDKDIEEMGINQLWRTALLSASLELRKSVLKGRIWGFGVDDDDNALVEHGRRVPSIVLEREEANTRESVHTSCDRVPLSKSCDLGTLRSNGYSSQSSSTLGFDSDLSNYNPSRRSTRPRAESASSVASSSAGRVREIVRNLERAASSSEDVIQGNEDAGVASSDMASESDEDSELAVAGNNTIIIHGPEGRSTNENVASRCSSPESNGIVIIASPSTSRISGASQATSELIKTPPLQSLTNLRTITRSRGAPTPLGRDSSEAKETRDEEPTIEALLQEEPQDRARATLWGAKAWEGEFPAGTSRRVPASASVFKASTEPLAKSGCSQEEMINVPRAVWDNLCRRLDETERRIAMLEMQEAVRRNETRILGTNSADDHDTPKPSLPGGLSPITLPPYLVIVSVGVCAVVAEYVFGRVVGRRPRL